MANTDLASVNEPVARQKYFTYYATGDEPMIFNIDFEKPFEMDEIRLHLSVAFASTEDLIIKLSSAFGSAYDATIMSYAMSGHTDLLYKPTRTMHFGYNDRLSVQLSMKSAVNYFGLTIQGWGVTD